MKFQHAALLTAVSFSLLVSSCETKPKKVETGTDSTKVQSAAIPVEAIVAKTMTITDTIRGFAPIQGYNDVMITSQSAGTITAVQAKLGKRVSKGSVLITVDNRVQRAGVAQAEVAVSQATLAYTVAKELFEKGNGSKAELIGAETGLTAAKAGLAMAKLNLENCQTTSPVSGIITSVENSVQVGSSAGPGAPIARIVDISKLKLQFHASETEVGRIKVGQKVQVNVAATQASLSGTVTAVAAASTLGSGSFAVEMVVTNPGEIVKAGMGAESAIITGTTSSGIIIPSTAIVEKDGKKGVWIAKDKSATFSICTARSAGAGKVIVESGLAEGDTIILTGISRLTTNAAIAVTIKPSN